MLEKSQPTGHLVTLLPGALALLPVSLESLLLRASRLLLWTDTQDDQGFYSLWHQRQHTRMRGCIPAQVRLEGFTATSVQGV